jgi:hypothetical protein
MYCMRCGPLRLLLPALFLLFLEMILKTEDGGGFGSRHQARGAFKRNRLHKISTQAIKNVAYVPS